MGIKENIEKDFIGALKQKDLLTVSTLRMLKAAIQNKEIEKKGRASLTDEEIIPILRKQLQQRQDSIAYFQKGARQELVEKESKELEIIKKYLPPQLTPEEITAVVDLVVSEMNPQDKKTAGTVIKLTMEKIKGKASGQLVSQIVSERFSPSNKKE
ncbi:MAG: GatB/YqeY domain-containing protein [Candidatus Firestonebacteria bacterium]